MSPTSSIVSVRPIELYIVPADYRWVIDRIYLADITMGRTLSIAPAKGPRGNKLRTGCLAGLILVWWQTGLLIVVWSDSVGGRVSVWAGTVITCLCAPAALTCPSWAIWPTKQKFLKEWTTRINPWGCPLNDGRNQLISWLMSNSILMNQFRIQGPCYMTRNVYHNSSFV